MLVARLAALSVAYVLLPVPLMASMVNEEVAHGHHHHKHHKHHKLHKAHHSHHRHHVEQQVTDVTSLSVAHKADAAPSAAYEAVQKEVQNLATQIEKTNEKWELENERCCQERQGSESTMEALDEEIAQANGDSGRATKEILKANKKITENENKIPEEKEAMRTLKQQCGADKISFEKDLEISLSNLEGLDSMAMSDCDAAASLLQCEHPTSGESFLMLRHDTVQKSAAQWQNAAVQRLLKPLATSSQASGGRPVVFMQLQDHTDPMKCTMQANPECQQIRDRYFLMTSDYEDSVDEIKGKEKEGENECTANIESIEENIQNAEVQLAEAQRALAEATADYNQAMEASRLKNTERKDHLAQMDEQAKSCQKNKGGLIEEKNGYLKIRGELLSMKGLKIFMQDCKVSDYTPGECSATCGGGTRVSTRDIMVQPIGDSAKCPVLRKEEKCNEQHCPIDCAMGEWGGWSSCSAKCGGGVFTRVRDIDRREAHGGKPCGEAQETQSCNPQSCDTNCVLGHWSQWSACSKACDAGTSFKVRRVKTPLQGQGKCAHRFSKKRYHSKSCHTQPCLKEEEVKLDKSLKCNSKRDVVLLVDGSASLKNSGWDAMKKAVGGIIKAMGTDVDMSVLLFSGPKTKKNYFKCSGQKWPNRWTGKFLGPPNMERDCLVKWVEHFTNDKEKLSTAVEEMEWPRGSTLTSEGLAMAETELNTGRKDAESVVVVITDGKPMNKRKVYSSVARLRRKARLMWVSLSANAPKWMIKQWASRPWTENTVFVDGVKALTEKKTVNRIVADMCPDMQVV